MCTSLQPFLLWRQAGAFLGRLDDQLLAMLRVLGPYVCHDVLLFTRLTRLLRCAAVWAQARAVMEGQTSQHSSDENGVGINGQVVHKSCGLWQ